MVVCVLRSQQLDTTISNSSHSKELQGYVHHTQLNTGLRMLQARERRSALPVCDTSDGSRSLPGEGEPQDSVQYCRVR